MRLFYVYLPIVYVESPVRTVLTFKNFYHQVANDFSYVRRSCFLEKKDDFFLEKNFFFKIGKGGNFAVECVSINIIS